MSKLPDKLPSRGLNRPGKPAYISTGTEPKPKTPVAVGGSGLFRS